MKRNGYHFERKVVRSSQVWHLINQAIADKKGFSLSRFGIGEISYLSWPENSRLVYDFKKYQKYAGVVSSVGKIKKELVAALKMADVVGVITPERLEFWPSQTKKVFEQLTFLPRVCCCAWMFQDALREGEFWPSIRGRKIILVGRRAKEAQNLFENKGVQVIRTLEMNADTEMENVVNTILGIDGWQIALISAGIPATILAPRIAQASQKVAIDFGHTLDMLIEGEKFDHAKKVKEWNEL